MTEIAQAVSHAQYVEAFYTTALFKTERLILSLVLLKPSTDRQARELALGQRDSFAAWQVEKRDEDQLILAAGRTRSWLMVAPAPTPGVMATRLYFGSAIVPARGARAGSNPLGSGFSALLGFHQLYSRGLLHAARTRLERGR
ncbi:hypothetical protein [Solimonas sp. K1W22B-7]|uniref:hypothetical protein n=1 Tax=Solimonas sp. K1W22B-7 TaxID=2303331 RepID=UPI001968CAF0|nr:hypothetical protein [Solimonas sp. K1W22B-7]